MATRPGRAGARGQRRSDRTGSADFNELFIDGVVVPVDNLIGAENNGWAVAQGTLAAERAIVVLEMTERLRRNGIEAAFREAAGWRLDRGEPALGDSAVPIGRARRTSTSCSSTESSCRSTT